MRPLLHLVRKESLLLLRDWNALLLLFVMPAIFILIMSLALQSRFAAESGKKMTYYLVNQDAGAVNEALLENCTGCRVSRRFVRGPIRRTFGAGLPAVTCASWWSCRRVSARQ